MAAIYPAGLRLFVGSLVANSAGKPETPQEDLAGTARLSIIAPAAIAGFVAQSLHLYGFPLFFAFRALPEDTWETFFLGFVAVWLPGAPLTGALCTRWGERTSWGLGGVCLAILATAALLTPGSMLSLPVVMVALGACAGLAGCLVWVGGISLAQVVPARRKGLANMFMMIGLGLGGVIAPPMGRGILMLLGTTEAGFAVLLGLVGLIGLVSGGLVCFWGQRPGESPDHATAEDKYRLANFTALLRNPRFRFFALSLGLVGGAVMQTANVYKVYRAKELGLIQGAEDTGWAALEFTGYAMQFLGSLLVWRLAGRSKGPWLPAAVLIVFGGFAWAIGSAPTGFMLFPALAGFELSRQLMRWLQTGYVTEHVAASHRASAVGLATMMSGTGGLLIIGVYRLVQDFSSTAFSSSLPFFVAGGLAMLAGLSLTMLPTRAARTGIQRGSSS